MATTATIARIAAMTVSIGNFEVCCGSGSGVDVPDGVGDGVGVGVGFGVAEGDGVGVAVGVGVGVVGGAFWIVSVAMTVIRARTLLVYWPLTVL